EYQVLDDALHANGKNPLTTAGSLYELKGATNKRLKKVGQWNTGRIVAKGTKFEHFVNGRLVLSVDTASDEFDKAVANSKFKKQEKYAQNPTGQIMLQDHNDEVWFRNLRIKVLD
ncbi:MAG: 3-keto-disaccharide hydrolase, partial [Planctomycetota bacterium]